MEIRKDLYYTKSHEWVEFEGANAARIGLTDYAQDQLGDIVYVNLPEIGDEFAHEEAIANVESVKVAADVFAPIAGTVIEINESLIDGPELINEEPYETWIVKLNDITENNSLLSAAEYEEFIASEEH